MELVGNINEVYRNLLSIGSLHQMSIDWGSGAHAVLEFSIFGSFILFLFLSTKFELEQFVKYYIIGCAYPNEFVWASNSLAFCASHYWYKYAKVCKIFNVSYSFCDSIIFYADVLCNSSNALPCQNCYCFHLRGFFLFFFFLTSHVA